jgi:hypothetical protein
MSPGDQAQTAYAAFLERIAAAVADDATTQRIVDAYAEYMEVAGRAAASAAGTFEAYQALVTRALDDDMVRPFVTDAFQRFVRAVGQALGDGSPQASDVAAAAEVLGGAAWITAVATHAEPTAAVPIGRNDATRNPETATSTSVDVPAWTPDWDPAWSSGGDLARVEPTSGTGLASSRQSGSDPADLGEAEVNPSWGSTTLIG